MRKKRFLVYCITNLVNGRMYIGKCQYGIQTRWMRHAREAEKHKNGCSYLAKAIRKYGRDNFKIEEIDEAKDAQSLIELEAKHILEKNTMSPNGYNLIYRGPDAYDISEETRDKYRANFYANLAPLMKTPEMSEKYSRSQQGRRNVADKINGSRFVGVFWDLKKTRWYAKLNRNNQAIRLGYFDTEELAAEAYDAACLEHFGETATFNFPDKLNLYLSGYKPERRMKKKDGRFKHVTRFKKGKPAWVGIFIYPDNSRVAKVFREHLFDDAELEAHLWRLEREREFKETQLQTHSHLSSLSLSEQVRQQRLSCL